MTKSKKKRKKRGRPVKYHDSLHRYWREQYRKRKKKRGRK